MNLVTITVKLKVAGPNTGPFFDLYAIPYDDIIPYVTGITKSILLSGYTLDVPSDTQTIRLLSTGVCNKYVDVSINCTEQNTNIILSPTPTVTQGLTPTPTSTPGLTPTPTPSGGVTSTPTPSPTPTKTVTPTPTETNIPVDPLVNVYENCTNPGNYVYTTDISNVKAVDGSLNCYVRLELGIYLSAAILIYTPLSDETGNLTAQNCACP